MRKVLVSIAAIAAIAAVSAATPAVAKNGHGRGHGAAHRGHDRGDFDAFRRDAFGAARFGQREGFCPPGLARKNNGCLPPGQARKLGIGDRLPAALLGGYNLPLRYRDAYRDDYNNLYRYDDDRIYRVNRGTGLIDQVISVLGL